jgi:glyoxylase-like metal-dependent hydrolase (beta-lactamase superfamily II)
VVDRFNADLVRGSCILIDCGKTFNRAVVDYFPPNGIRKIDGESLRLMHESFELTPYISAVILTHDHADGELLRYIIDEC